MSKKSQGLQIEIDNQCSFSIRVYTSETKKTIQEEGDLSTDLRDYAPIYTLKDVVKAQTSKTLEFEDSIVMLVAKREEDDFPLRSEVFMSFDNPPLSFSITKDDLERTQNAWQCYIDLHKDPYAPFADEYNAALINATSDADLRQKTKETLEKYKYTCSYEDLNLVFYWGRNNLHALLQDEKDTLFYVYQGLNYIEAADLLLQKAPIGYLWITNKQGEAQAWYYHPKDQDNGVQCAYEDGILTPPDAAELCPIDIVYNFTLKDGAFCFLGTKEEDGGKRTVIVQPEENPEFPWWILCYDACYFVFHIAELAMNLQMAIVALKIVGKTFQFLKDNMKNLLQSLKDKLVARGTQANPLTEPEELGEGFDLDPVNVDVDVDNIVETIVDTVEDTIVDTEVDTETDIDTDVDVDSDIDIPFIFIDIDIDININIDINIVIDIVEEIVIDIEIDISVETVIETSLLLVAKGFIPTLLKKAGRWLITKGWKEILKNAVITGAFTGFGKLLDMWKEQAEDELKDLSPQQMTGVALLINHMINEEIPSKDRWSVFGNLVQDLNTYPEEDTEGWSNSQGMQKSYLTMIISSGKGDDSGVNWDSSERDGLIQQMLQYKSPSDQHQAYSEVLANYQYEGKSIPTVSAASVAKNYLGKISTKGAS